MSITIIRSTYNPNDKTAVAVDENGKKFSVHGFDQGDNLRFRAISGEWIEEWAWDDAIDPKTLTVEDLQVLFANIVDGKHLGPDAEVYYWDKDTGVYTPATEVFVSPEGQVFIN